VPEHDSHSEYQLELGASNRIFEDQIAELRLRALAGVEAPEFRLYGAQPGAGKSRLQAPHGDELKAKSGPGSVANIDIDDYRTYHPQYRMLAEQDPGKVAERTNRDAWLWTERAVEYVQRLRPHVLEAGTLREPDFVLRKVRGYLEAGFATHLYVLAVHEYVSRVRAVIRYLHEVGRQGYGRLVSREFHDEAYRRLPGALRRICDSGTFDSVSILGRNGEVLICTEAGVTQNSDALVAGLEEGRTLRHVDVAAVMDSIRRADERALALHQSRWCHSLLMELAAEVGH